MNLPEIKARLTEIEAKNFEVKLAMRRADDRRRELFSLVNGLTIKKD